MKIVNANHFNSVPFENVKVDDTFFYKGDLFVKCDSIVLAELSLSNDVKNAYCLNHNYFIKFEGPVLVELVDIELHYQSRRK